MFWKELKRERNGKSNPKMEFSKRGHVILKFHKYDSEYFNL